MQLHGEIRLYPSQRFRIVNGTPVQNLLNVADREDMEELRDVRSQRKFSPLVLVQNSNFGDWSLGFLGKERNYSRLVWLLLGWS